jgi:hypothetical protein
MSSSSITAVSCSECIRLIQSARSYDAKACGSPQQTHEYFVLEYISIDTPCVEYRHGWQSRRVAVPVLEIAAV